MNFRKVKLFPNQLLKKLSCKYFATHIYVIINDMCGIFMEKKNLKTRITEASGMPKDVILGVPLVTVIGQNETCIENYRGILEYTDKLIRIQTKLGKIHVLGTNLQIERYTNDEMKIIGHISIIEFYEGG